MEGRRAGVSEEKVQEVVKRFREEFSSEENRELITILPGVEEGLEVLSKHFTLGVLSNSTLKSLERDLGHLRHHFSFMVPDARKPDPTAYLSTLTAHSLTPTETAYIGDALSDIRLAKSTNSLSIGILTGMGTRKHLESAKPDYLATSFPHLVEILQAAKCSGAI
eukprot:TRINITY_DN49727_c0_g1_i1.p1 TRINITY_DN49727_c0_g1~~TRINITY_DN49727_c0_g1_i1.p1  ORF type:complete len:188 (+),score=38.17 TRINITY_DN49727_c0_g1_i1:72-566(+)